MDTHFQHYRITKVFQKISNEQANALASFWLQNKAITDPNEAKRRTSEAVSIIHNAKDEIVGVCTAYPSTHVDGKLYYFGRMFIRPADRIPGMWQFIIRDAYDHLKELAIPNKPIGILMVTENPKLMRKGARRMLEHINFQFTGKNQHGQDILTSTF